MILKIKPDLQKSESLKKMAQITLERLRKTNIEEYPSNTLLDYYDIIHQLLDAILLRKGVKIKGDGAHYEIIEHAALQKIISEQTRLFLQQMREYRNRISYEGFMVHQNYITLNHGQILKIIEQLFEFSG